MVTHPAKKKKMLKYMKKKIFHFIQFYRLKDRSEHIFYFLDNKYIHIHIYIYTCTSTIVIDISNFDLIKRFINLHNFRTLYTDPWFSQFGPFKNFHYMNKSNNVYFRTIQESSHFIPFQNCYILDHSRVCMLWTIPELLHSGQF